MALIKCPNCNKEISDTTDTCIHCGNSIQNNHKKNNNIKSNNIKRVLIIIAIFFILFCIAQLIYNTPRDIGSSKKFRYNLYNGIYILEDISLKIEDNNIVQAIDERTDTDIVYKYQYSKDNKIENIKYEGKINSVSTYGNIDFEYNEDNLVEFIKSDYSNEDMKNSVIYKYYYNNDSKIIKFEIDENNPLADVSCNMAYYKDYVIEECYNRYYNSGLVGGKHQLNIYQANDISDNSFIWNKYKILPFSLYDYDYPNLSQKMHLINGIASSTLFNFGKLLYHSELDKLTDRYFYDSSNRILKDNLSLYIYDNDKVIRAYEHLKKYYVETLIFDDKGYTCILQEVNEKKYHKIQSKLKKYYDDNVVNKEIDEILENLKYIFQNNYKTEYKDYPSVDINGITNDTITSIPLTFTIKLNQVNNFKVLLNGNDITLSCREDSDNTKKYYCDTDSDYLQIGTNTIDVYISNANYKDILESRKFTYSVDELVLKTSSEIVKFINYGKEIHPQSFSIYVPLKGKKIKYSIQMDDIIINNEFTADIYEEEIDLSAFALNKYDKSGSKNAILTITDQYGRTITKNLTFIYE